jgi:hypothetical protein
MEENVFAMFLQVYIPINIDLMEIECILFLLGSWVHFPPIVNGKVVSLLGVETTKKEKT